MSNTMSGKKRYTATFLQPDHMMSNAHLNMIFVRQTLRNILKDIASG